MSLICCEICLENEPGLKKFINHNGTISDCNYCQNKNKKTVHLEKLIDHILICLKEIYCITRSNNNSETLSDFMENYFPVQKEKLLQDAKTLIKSKLGKVHLIDRRGFLKKWDDFSNYVKKEKRFFFSSQTNILQEAMKIIEKNDLKKNIKPTKQIKIYRARAFTEGNCIVNDLRRMGPPEPEDIMNTSNRMSPPRIPILYASFDKKMALTEISLDHKGLAYIAEFQLLKEIQVIDLTLKSNEEIPSFFDINENQRKKRNDLIFIQEFATKLSEPIKKDGREHTDYVPTQILSEYIKKQGSHGIIYGSSKDSQGKNIALFFSQKNICENEETKNDDIYLKFYKDDNKYNLPFIKNDMEEYWKDIKNAEEHEHIIPDLKMKVDYEDEPFKIIQRIYEGVQNINELLDSLEESDILLPDEIIEFLSKNRIPTEKLFDNNFKNPFFNKNWELHNLSKNNHLLRLKIDLVHFEIKFLEEYLKNNKFNFKTRTKIKMRMEKCKKILMEFAKTAAHAD